MKQVRTSAFGLAGLLFLAAVAQACGSAVVGGTCADGAEECNGRCVLSGTCGAKADATFDPGDAGASADDVASDTRNDSLSPVTPPDTARDGDLVDGSDVGTSDGSGDAPSSSDASADDAADDATPDVSDAGSDDVIVDSAEIGGDADASDDAGATSDADDDAPPVDACPPPPFDTPSNCGACGVVCFDPTPACKPAPADPDAGADADGGPGYACAPYCDAPTTYCSGVCVDTSIDPYNCGGCGVFCPSGLCNGGKCRGARAGHFVTIGHDYAGVAPSTAVAKVVENAVFLPSTNPVKVLAFDQWADKSAGGSVESVGAILDGAKSGRTWSAVHASSASDVLAKLNIDAFDVLLVYDQPTAPAGALAGLGDDLAAQLLSFGQSGGVVVVLDGGGGVDEMAAFLDHGGVLGIAGERSGAGVTLENTAPTDAVGLDVLSTYLAPPKTITFHLADPPTKDVVTVIDDPSTGRSVVVHKVVKKP